MIALSMMSHLEVLRLNPDRETWSIRYRDLGIGKIIEGLRRPYFI